MEAASEKRSQANDPGSRAFSEAASEKQGQARKRGRPAVLDEATIEVARRFFPEVQSERGLRDVAYRLQAINVLTEDAAFAWLADSKTMMEDGDGGWKPGILTELGRLGHSHGVETMKAIARQLCEFKPKTKEAIAMIRRWRSGLATAASCLELTDKLGATINTYVREHPDTTFMQIRGALRNAMDLLDEPADATRHAS